MIAPVSSTSFEGESSLFGSMDWGASLGASDGPPLEVGFQSDADVCRKVARHVHSGQHQLAAMAKAATGGNGLRRAAPGCCRHGSVLLLVRARARDLARTHPWMIYEL